MLRRRSPSWAGALLAPVATFASVAFLASAGAAPCVLAQDVGSESDLITELQLKKDDADAEVVRKLAALKTAGAAKALIEVYPKLQSIWMRREVVRALGQFEGVPAVASLALEQVANVAVNAIESELRDAAFETLAASGAGGRIALGKIVELPAQDQVRERALELHAAAATKDDGAFYKKLWADEKLPKKLREKAFAALAKTLETPELTKQFKDAHDGSIRRIALDELQTRSAAGIGDFALDALKQVNSLPTDRVEAAKVLAKTKGPKAADELIDVAMQQATTPELLREGIADLLAGMNDDGVNKKLVALVGKGKPHEKRFALLAVRHLLPGPGTKDGDDKLLKKVRSHLDDKDAEVRRVAIRILGEQKDAGSADELDKLLAKTKDSGDGPAIVAALTKIRGADAAWTKRLVELANDPDRDLRNAALQGLLESGGAAHLLTFVQRLSNPDWSTRLVALHAIETLRDRDSLGPVIAQMQQEKGRMLVEFSNTLFRLTGELHDTDAPTWQKWWDSAGKETPLISAEELKKREEERERRRLRQTTSARFFGVKIESHYVVFVVDISGSMAEQLQSTIVEGRPATRMDVVKQEIEKSLKALDSSASFNLITFNAAVTKWKEGVQLLNDKTRAEALEYVAHLGSRGGTNIYDAMQTALADPRVDTIFLLTDGEPSSGTVTDLQLIREHIARWNDTRHVKIHCVGVGGDFPLLEWIATDSGGSYLKFN